MTLPAGEARTQGFVVPLHEPPLQPAKVPEAGAVAEAVRFPGAAEPVQVVAAASFVLPVQVSAVAPVWSVTVTEQLEFPVTVVQSTVTASAVFTVRAPVPELGAWPASPG